ncbi:lantibiotic dehydratase C-terminal domain-containing protein [Streptomyces sp. NPDC056160]|uniref:lantibiotic dehydratase C-terminal domain-containing protein n=1 Tax=Streptomyces sp. NPDC056160 TaxID=3345731 RepID=UPI0035DAF2F4
MLNREPSGVPDRESEGRWVSAHVFTAHPLDLVVRELVPRVSEELRGRGLIDRHFFLRHWQGGPHLRLRVRLTAPAAESAARDALAAHAAAFFRTRPSSRPMSEHQYHVLAAQLAAQEPESEPGTPAPNNSLAFCPYRPEHTKYGHGAALRVVEESFATCSELATTAVVEGWGTARRMAHCFALLAGSTDTTASSPHPPAPDVVAQYRHRRAALLGVARAARRTATATATATGAVPPGAGPAFTDPAGTPPADADPVTRWLDSCRHAQRQAADPARLAGHLTHLACNRLGVRLDQEATLRGLALLAVAELTGGGPAIRPLTEYG